MIDEKVLIERLEDEKAKGHYDSNSVIGEKNVWNKAIQIIKDLASEHNNGWISVEDMLPSETFGCIVTVMDCEPMTQTEFENILPYRVGYDGRTWNDIDGAPIPFEVIAWQPLPSTPYHKGE